MQENLRTGEVKIDHIEGDRTGKGPSISSKFPMPLPLSQSTSGTQALEIEKENERLFADANQIVSVIPVETGIQLQ